jgi:nitrogen regulatory protein PII
MKAITALIPPTKLMDVKDAVLALGIELMTVTSVMVCGPKSGGSEPGNGASGEENFLNKTRIDIVVSDDRVEAAIAAIIRRSKNGKPGVGMIFTTEVPQLLTI